jgi:hypothetical protein
MVPLTQVIAYLTFVLGWSTNFVGVSYCETSDLSLNENNIEVVNNWPSRYTKIGTKEKVPSKISLDGTQ